MKLNLVALPLLAAFFLVIVPSATAGDRMQSGQWELTSGDAPHSRTSKQCVAPEDVKAINGSLAELRTFIEKPTTAAGCTLQNFRSQGNTFSYTTACAKSSTDSTTTYHGDAYEMEMTTKAGAALTTRHVKARRLGDCP